MVLCKGVSYPQFEKSIGKSKYFSLVQFQLETQFILRNKGQIATVFLFSNRILIYAANISKCKGSIFQSALQTVDHGIVLCVLINGINGLCRIAILFQIDIIGDIIIEAANIKHPAFFMDMQAQIGL